MIKRFAATAILLLLLSVAAVAQTITVAPDPRYSSAIVPGAIVVGTLEGGQVFTFGTVFRGNGLFKVTAVPGDISLTIVQIWSNKWMFKLNVPSLAGVTGIRFQWPGHDVTTALTGANIPAEAKPTLLTTGSYTSFQNPVAQSFNGTITFGPAVGLITIALHGSAFGNPGQWVVEIAGGGGNFLVEMPAQSIGLGQGNPELLLFQIPRLSAGVWFFQARSITYPGVVSNVVSLQIVS